MPHEHAMQIIIDNTPIGWGVEFNTEFAILRYRWTIDGEPIPDGIWWIERSWPDLVRSTAKIDAEDAILPAPTWTTEISKTVAIAHGDVVRWDVYGSNEPEDGVVVPWPSGQEVDGYVRVRRRRTDVDGKKVETHSTVAKSRCTVVKTAQEI